MSNENKILTFIFLFLISCGTSDRIRVREQNRSLIDLSRAIKSVMGDPKSVNQSGREFISQYFSRVPSEKFDPNNSRERLVAIFTILGDRRPYDVEILVIAERKDSTGYKYFRDEPEIAKQLQKELAEKLTNSQDGVNLIDDFRTF